MFRGIDRLWWDGMQMFPRIEKVWVLEPSLRWIHWCSFFDIWWPGSHAAPKHRVTFVNGVRL